MTLLEDASDAFAAPHNSHPPAPNPGPVPNGFPWIGREILRPSRPAGGRRGGIGLWVMSSIALLAGWFVFHALVLTAVQERSTQSRLYAQFRQQLAEETAPLGAAIPRGSPVALLSSGRGMHNEVVVEGTMSAQLTSGPGHLSGTPLPGQTGVSVLFGRSVTYGAPFGQVSAMTVGDPIKVVTGQGSFVYRVTAVRGPGSPLPEPLKSGQSRLTLVTSDSSGWPGGWGGHVIYVDLLLAKGKVYPSSAASVAMTSDSLPMRGDSADLASVVFWLQALLVVAVGGAWAWSRWTPRQAWMAGLPLLLAVLWGATGAIELLLPNLV